jgi:L-alanine-DL-glutamate epimerase-like enolase superfamily enzyme
MGDDELAWDLRRGETHSGTQHVVELPRYPRYYARDVTSPFLLDDHLSVPTGPGLGVDPDPVFLDEITTSKEWMAL